MRLSKKAQYAICFVLYLREQGPSNTSRVALDLNISHSFIEQISRKLRKAGIVTVKRGPGGGYTLVGAPTIGAILNAVETPTTLVSSSERAHYLTEDFAHDFVTLTDSLNHSLSGLFSRTVDDVLSYIEVYPSSPSVMGSKNV